MKKTKWLKPLSDGTTNNEILNVDDTCFISYTSDSSLAHLSGLLAAFANQFLTPEEALRDGEETALVKRGIGGISNTYYILTGDFRKEYEAAASGGFEACYKVFEKYKKTHYNNWSTKV